MMKYYYLQRQGIDIEEKYASDFARKNLHPGDAAVRRWSDRNNPGAETFDITKGWYDAGDYGKYTSAGATSVENLLLAYDLFPQVFLRITPDIPETDPEAPAYADAPGILSEIKWEIDMLLKLEHADHDGSFYVAANYKDGTIYLEDTLYSTSDHMCAKHIIELLKTLEVYIEDSNVCAHTYSYLAGVHADSAAAEDNNVSLGSTGNTGEEYAGTSELLLKILCALLNRKTTCDLAHGCKERE